MAQPTGVVHYGEPVETKIIVYEGNRCPRCGTTIVAPSYKEGFRAWQVVLCILLFMIGIIPGIIFLVFFCYPYFIPYCPNCRYKLA